MSRCSLSPIAYLLYAEANIASASQLTWEIQLFQPASVSRIDRADRLATGPVVRPEAVVNLFKHSKDLRESIEDFDCIEAAIGRRPSAIFKQHLHTCRLSLHLHFTETHILNWHKLDVCWSGPLSIGCAGLLLLIGALVHPLNLWRLGHPIDDITNSAQFPWIRQTPFAGPLTDWIDAAVMGSSEVCCHHGVIGGLLP